MRENMSVKQSRWCVIQNPLHEKVDGATFFSDFFGIKVYDVKCAPSDAKPAP